MGEMADYVNDSQDMDEEDISFSFRMFEKTKTVKLEIVKVVAGTDKAWLIEYKKGNSATNRWFPKSQCEISKDSKIITVPEWILAEEK